MASTPYIKYFTKVQYNFHSKLQGYRLPGTGYCYIFETDTRDSCIVHHRSSTTDNYTSIQNNRASIHISNWQCTNWGAGRNTVKCQKALWKIIKMHHTGKRHGGVVDAFYVVCYIIIWRDVDNMELYKSSKLNMIFKTQWWQKSLQQWSICRKQ